MELAAIAEHVIKNGTERKLKAPLSRNLGFNQDVVVTRAMRHKSDASPDNKSHAFYVIYSTGKDGKLAPQEIVLGNAQIIERDGQKYVDGFDARTDLKGNLLAAVKSSGPAGQVAQNPLPTDSQAAIDAFNAERSIHTEKLDVSKLTK